MSERDRLLIKAATGGDQHAFEQLLGQSRARIHGVISNYMDAPGAEREVMYQIAIEAAWRSCKSGKLNPDADWFAQCSRSMRNRLISECDYLRAEKRWTGSPTVSLDALEEDGAPVLGSWVTYCDPLRVVIGKETLRDCWALTTERQRGAVARWLGGDTSERTTSSLGELRRKVRPLLASPIGVHPTLSTDRRCKHCRLPLPGDDLRMRVHPGCRKGYRWTRHLELHAAARPAPALPVRLV